MRAALVLALLLCGCVQPSAGPVTARPIEGDGQDACLRVEVAASPPEIHAGENATVFVTLTGCETQTMTLASTEQCTRWGFHPELHRGQEAFHLWRGTSARREAPGPDTCGVVRTVTTIPPRQTLGDTFLWDGREVQPGVEPERIIRMVEGRYQIVVRVETHEAYPAVGFGNVTLLSS